MTIDLIGEVDVIRNLQRYAQFIPYATVRAMNVAHVSN